MHQWTIPTSFILFSKMKTKNIKYEIHLHCRLNIFSFYNVHLCSKIVQKHKSFLPFQEHQPSDIQTVPSSDLLILRGLLVLHCIQAKIKVTSVNTSSNSIKIITFNASDSIISCFKFDSDLVFFKPFLQKLFTALLQNWAT